MKLVMLHSKKTPEYLATLDKHYATWEYYTGEDFYEPRKRDSIKSKYHMIPRFDEDAKIFYIIDNENDGFRYRNARLKKL